jgi:hypothetical protein
MMSPPGASRSFVTPSATSLSTRWEFDHSSGSVSVEETTYFGIVLNLSANSPSRDGHAAAKPS